MVLPLAAAAALIWLQPPPAAPQTPAMEVVSVVTADDEGGGLTFTPPALAPGETSEVPVRVVAGPGGTLYLATRAVTTSLLDQDPVHGLQIRLRECARAWRPVAGTSGHRCDRRAATVSGWSPIISAPRPLPQPSPSPGGPRHLLIDVRLPLEAGNEFQGSASSIEFRFIDA